MDAERIVRITPETIRELLESHRPAAQSKAVPGKRLDERWPFPGTVEVWLPGDAYGERHLLATLHNLSQGGLAMRTRRPVTTDTRLSIAVHLPQLTCYGHALVRHCTRAAVGYLIGVEFVFTDEDDGA